MNVTTLVAPKHFVGPAVNGHDGCHARCANHGRCPGTETAQWLNGLGEDWQLFTSDVTNGTVRANWLRNSNHIVAVDPELAALTAQREQLRRNLETVNRRLSVCLQAKRRAQGAKQ